MEEYRPVVIDANIAVALALVVPYTDWAVQRMEEWERGRIPIYAPTLWPYEVVSALRKAVLLGIVTEEEALVGLESLWDLGVECIPPDRSAHRDALRWAGRLGQPVAYDAQYLVLAERLEATFWTADRRLAARAREAGADWVRCLLDLSPSWSPDER